MSAESINEQPDSTALSQEQLRLVVSQAVDMDDIDTANVASRSLRDMILDAITAEELR